MDSAQKSSAAGRKTTQGLWGSAQLRSMSLRELRPAPTSAIADWIVSAGEGTWGHVDSMVPAVFDAYVLVLYPLYDDDDVPVRWADWPVQPVPIDVQDGFGGNPRSVLPLMSATLARRRQRLTNVASASGRATTAVRSPISSGLCSTGHAVCGITTCTEGRLTQR